MIIFEKIKWKNFLSTGNAFTEVELNKNSSTLILGDNGAGKSTILDALTFVYLVSHLDLLIKINSSIQ